MDLLTENNKCGQQILHIVANGNSNIAELTRLSNHVPSVFKLDTKALQQKYGDVLLDFAYFKSPSICEKKIESSTVLSEVDEEIRETHGTVLAKIYSSFESVHRYITELLQFLQDLSDGVYIQRTLESIFLDEDGKQLMCEALYLYGVLLLTIEALYPGPTRERLIVAFQRYFGRRATSRDTNIDDVCKLLRSTGFLMTNGSKRPNNYPEHYFSRIEVPEAYVDLVLGYLKSDDIYHQVQVYPLPDHRTAALANQAAMLYVCLYFSPSTLHSHSARMREIVDKFFSDNWIVSYYMGRTVNLIEVWDSYKAARTALNNILEVSNIKLVSNKMANSLERQIKVTDNLLSEGRLTQRSVLENSVKIMNVLRQCNVVLRWVILHTSRLSLSGGESIKKCVNLRQQVITEMHFDPSVAFDLLLKTSNLELHLCEAFKSLLADKEIKYSKYRESAQKRAIEIASAFDGSQPLVKVTKNARLNAWFNEIGEQIRSLSLEQSSFSARKIIQIIHALKQVRDFHELETSAGIMQAVNDVNKDLKALAKVSGINDSDLVTLFSVSDLSYAWLLIEDYTGVMQKSIKQGPDYVSPLRAVFLKLSSGLELPLLRINQAKSEQLLTVSAHYSGQLVAYIRKVLQIVPETMFGLLKEITRIRSSMLEVPTRLDKDKFKDFAQLDQRFEMAELTHRVGCLAEGVSKMKSTLVGVLEIDPAKLLEEGVRRELVHQVANLLHRGFIFTPKSKNVSLCRSLVEVGSEMKALRSSFEYIQDYINCYGMKMWQEEVNRIMNYYVQQECNPLLKRKITDLGNESAAIPIPNLPPTDSVSVNFIGRLVRELLRVTNPRGTIYNTFTGSWFDSKTRCEVVTSDVMAEVEGAIGVEGLVGVDKLVSFLIVKELQDLLSNVEKKLECGSQSLKAFEELIAETKHLNGVYQPQRRFTDWIQRYQKLCTNVLENLLKIGQMQVVRCQIANQLRMSCKLHARSLFTSLEALNLSLLTDVQKHIEDATKPYPDPDGSLISELSVYLERCGWTNPLDKIYVLPKTSEHVPVILFATVMCHFTSMVFCSDVGGLTIPIKSGGEHLDAHCLAVGVSTVLRQLHSSNSEVFLRMIGQFANSFVLVTAGHPTAYPQAKLTDFPSEVTASIAFLKKVSQIIGIVDKCQSKYVTPSLLSEIY